MVDNTNNIDVSDAFAPVVEANAEILILGSMPSVKSLRDQQYYAHPRNGFWPIMQSLFDLEANLNYVDACQQLIHNKIALWDVIKRCQRNGSLDSNIMSDSIELNDFKHFLNSHADIKLIAFNGGKAEQLFNQHCVKTLTKQQAEIQRIRLPSTSPAHASLNLSQKTAKWRAGLFG